MTQVLPVLALVACPVSMGLMMWFMMRGAHRPQMDTPEHNEQRWRIAALKQELGELDADERAQGSHRLVSAGAGESVTDI